MKWCRLQLAITIADAPPEMVKMYPLLPGAPDHGSEDRITKTVGYKKLRAWFLHLSAGARERARRWMRHWIEGCEAAVSAAEKSGDFSGLKGITIDYIDTTGAPLPSLIPTNQEHEDGDSTADPGTGNEQPRDEQQAPQGAQAEGSADDGRGGG